MNKSVRCGSVFVTNTLRGDMHSLLFSAAWRYELSTYFFFLIFLNSVLELLYYPPFFVVVRIFFLVELILGCLH